MNWWISEFVCSGIQERTSEPLASVAPWTSIGSISQCILLQHHDPDKSPTDNMPFFHMDVSENNGTPKSSILIGFSIINHPFWGTPILWNTHMFVFLSISFWGYCLCTDTRYLEVEWNPGGMVFSPGIKVGRKKRISGPDLFQSSMFFLFQPWIWNHGGKTPPQKGTYQSDSPTFFLPCWLEKLESPTEATHRFWSSICRVGFPLPMA